MNNYSSTLSFLDLSATTLSTSSMTSFPKNTLHEVMVIFLQNIIRQLLSYFPQLIILRFTFALFLFYGPNLSMFHFPSVSSV